MLIYYREHEWLFGTEKGRMDLREKCLTDRLAVIFLSREQQYEDLEFIKKELDSFILKFAPPKLRHGVCSLLLEFFIISIVFSFSKNSDFMLICYK